MRIGGPSESILSGAVRGFKVVAKDVPEIRSLIKELLILLLDD
jgi:hypothetical protein